MVMWIENKCQGHVIWVLIGAFYFSGVGYKNVPYYNYGLFILHKLTCEEIRLRRILRYEEFFCFQRGLEGQIIG